MTPSSHASSDWTAYLRHDGPAAPVDSDAFAALMRHPDFPTASAYDPTWVYRNRMGPNALWLVDGLTQHLHLQPGMRVLDLGCGSAMTSIFLAREFGVSVIAADLWIEPTQNFARIDEAEVADLVTPLEAEAHTLPFAHGYFDAVVSVDSYHYFGTEVRYLSYLAQFVRPGGTIAVTVPGNEVDPDDSDDPGDGGYGADWSTFRSAAWWGRHWSRTNGVEVERAEMVPMGWDLWYRYLQAGAAWEGSDVEENQETGLLLSPRGRTLGFARVVARRTEGTTLQFGPGRYTTRIA